MIIKKYENVSKSIIRRNSGISNITEIRIGICGAEEKWGKGVVEQVSLDLQAEIHEEASTPKLQQPVAEILWVAPHPENRRTIVWKQH